MPEELFAVRPFASGGKGDVARSDLRMAIKAIRKEYSINEDIREKMVANARRIMEESTEEKTILLAIKMLAEMDKINAKREETDVQEKHNGVIEATSVMRAALQNPEVRKRMISISDEMCGAPPKVIETHLNGKQ